jgi:hypothetical protein
MAFYISRRRFYICSRILKRTVKRLKQDLHALEQIYFNFELQVTLFLKFVLRNAIAFSYLVVLNLIFIMTYC